MKKISVLFFFTLISIFCNGQTADELNQQSKDLLSEHNFKLAIPILKKAAEGGNAEAQYNYGVCFEQGIEVQKNDTLANEWYLKSAMQGYDGGEYKIAYSYAEGRCCAQNPEQAFYWSLKCAKQNDPDCMFYITGFYMDGVGVQKNIDSMLVWAIRLGSLPDIENLYLSGRITSARANLAVMYRDGNKIKKDLVKSYMWYLIFNESKRDFSIPDQQKNIDDIKELEKSLTQTDKDNAKKNAEKQIGRKLKNLANLYKIDTD